MTARRTKWCRRGLWITVIACVLFFWTFQASAKTELVPVDGASYNVNAPLADNLKTLVGKKVYVHLDSGTTLIGYVKETGNHFMHLEKLDRKDFFDALIAIEHIIAIDTQFRKYP